MCGDKNGDGKVNGDVDEILVQTYRSLGGRLPMTLDGSGIDADVTTLNVELFDAWADPYSPSPSGQNNQQSGANQNTTTALNWPPSGLVRIDDELIYYKSLGGTMSVTYQADVLPTLTGAPAYHVKSDHPPMRRDPNPPHALVFDTTSNANYAQVNQRQHQVMVLNGVKRGVLNTKAVEHSPGTQIMLLDAMPVTHLTGAFSGMSDSFMVNAANGFPQEGYAWINDEVLSWKKRDGNTLSGVQYFRGRFGTAQEDHHADDIVRCLPFRYWDRYVTQYDGDGLAFIQLGYRASGAKWYSLDMDLVGTDELPQVPTGVIPHVLVRFDGKPGWETIPDRNNPAALSEFHGKKAINFSSNEGRGVTADQIEVRVYWEYLPSAFKNGQGLDWKRTFSIEKFRALYGAPLIMRRLDELEKR